MGSRVDIANATQPQPLARDASGAYLKGAVYICAGGVGTGTWGGTYNVAPVSAAGVIGTPRQFAVSNGTPMLDLDLLTGASAYIGWWTNVFGVVTLYGSIEG